VDASTPDISLAQSVSKIQASSAPSQPPDPQLARAGFLTDSGKPDEAEAAVRQYLLGHPQSAEGHFLLGYILFREIQQNAKADTNCADNPTATCNSLVRDTNAKASLAEYTEGAKYKRPSASDLKIVALDYILLADYTDAAKWLTTLLGWDPNDAEGWYLLGRTRYNENQFASAARAFEQSLKLDPKNVKAKDNLGLCYAALGRSDEALAEYQAAITWQQDASTKNAGPFIDMGSLLLDLSKPDEAIPYLRQAAEIAVRDFKPHELLGKAYIRLERFPEAQLELQRAIELSPDVASVHCILVAAYRKQSLMDKAKIEADRCAALTGAHSSPDAPRP
jgi:tetratricopeptide (TPR) repeat protein